MKPAGIKPNQERKKCELMKNELMKQAANAELTINQNYAFRASSQINRSNQSTNEIKLHYRK